MKEKFTQGDWSAIACVVIADKGGKVIKPIGANNSNIEEVANANLIAAAPEMYRLLEEFSNMVMPTAGELYQKCEEAKLLLVKARGDNA